MRSAILIILLAAIAATAGAFYYYRSSMPGVTQSGTPTGTPVSFTEIVSGTQSTVFTRTNYLITSSAELTRLWKMIDAKGEPPTIDFSSTDVIAVFAGQEPTAGYAISVSSVHDAAKRVVEVTLTKPGGSCLLAQMLTAPYQIISIEKSALPLSHEDQTNTTSCLE